MAVAVTQAQSTALPPAPMLPPLNAPMSAPALTVTPPTPLGDGKMGWMAGTPPGFLEAVPPRDRSLLERVYTGMAELHEKEEDFPTEVALERALADDGKRTIWYNCVAYGYRLALTTKQQMVLQQQFGHFVRDSYVSLASQGTKQQSRGALVLQVWSHDQQEVRAQQAAQQDAGAVQNNNNKRVRAEGLLSFLPRVSWS